MVKLLGYEFNDSGLLEQALTHRSVKSKNNERLEYLGDAILGFIIADGLYSKFPDATEGELTRLRAYLVKGEKLAEIARSVNLSEYLKLGPGELKSGGWRRDSILANTLEAIFGAIYLDSGIEQCRTIILDLYRDHLENISPADIKKDYKTRLQEYLQSHKYNTPIYKVLHEGGSPHKPVFKVSCEIDVLDDAIYAEGQSKRKAEQAAAKQAFKILRSIEKTSEI